METFREIPEIRAFVSTERARGRSIGLVPTMGYLHAGHLALIAEAKRRCDVVVASIFVNPTQFAPTEDLATYPRDLAGDSRKLLEAGCAALFLPDPSTIYPPGFCTYVNVEGITSRYEGAIRPDHFQGVTTVVAKLFNIVAPDVAVFGQKDAQQAAVIRRMVADMNFNIDIEVIPTIRETDGLAMSSRNVYLSSGEKEEALSISRGLKAAAAAVREGKPVPIAEERLCSELSPSFAIDYADIVDGDTFEHAQGDEKHLLAVVAVKIGRTRLIDNMRLTRS